MSDPRWEQYRFETALWQHRMFIVWMAHAIMAGKIPSPAVIDGSMGLFDKLNWQRAKRSYIDRTTAQDKAISSTHENQTLPATVHKID